MTKPRLEKMALSALPYMLALLIAWLIIAYSPDISLFLPRLSGLMK